MDLPRERRNCRKLTTVPSRDDLIQVLWILDQVSSEARAEWCAADVLYVEPIRRGNILARGYIRYPAVNGLYEEQLDHVEFFPNNLLRCAKTVIDGTSEDEEAEQRDGRNEFPMLSWRFSLETGKQGDSDSDDENWVDCSKFGVSRKRKSVQEATHAGIESLAQDMLQLRKKYTYVQIELERMKKQTTEILTKVSRIEDPPSQLLDGQIQRILSRLRNRIVLKFQTPVRNLSSIRYRSSDNHISDSTVLASMDGIQKGAWRIKVECDLDQFELFARVLQRNEEMEKRIRFFPEYCHTQCPSRSSTEFHIIVPTFFDICAIFDIGSFSDRLEMMRKCCATQQSTVVRLVGSYVYDENSDTGPCYINVGSSGVFCSDCYKSEDINRPGQDTGSEEVNGNDFVAVDKLCRQGMKDEIPILMRTTRAWDLVDGRFLSPLKAVRGKACLGVEPTDLSDAAAANQLFQITWRRSADLSSRILSTDLSKTCTIHGTLEVVIPYIQLHGQILCAEFAAVATDDVLASVVSKNVSN